ncbi:MAG: hypothetical protein Q8941_15925 [Bacteroidota bacterium]|nr:hypothetical protein [Bacteroidota bacterium]
MFRVIKFTVIIFLFTRCNQTKQESEKEKEIQIGLLKISIPASTNFIKGRGVDSYVAYLINENRDTFHIEYGRPNIIYNLFDYPPKALPEKDKEGLQKNLGKLPSPDEAVFTKSPEQDNLQNIFQDNFYLYDTINSIIVKIVQPKRIGHGKTGLYIPELKDGNSFSIYASNLDSSLHRKALQMFKTIRYK